MESKKDRVKLNVGGRIFETTATTLASAGRNSLFGAMFDDNWNLHSKATVTEQFIDRNPDYFAVLLDLLRTGELCIPPNLNERFLYREALYYGILDNVRSAKWGPFDGNKLRLAQSVMGWSTGDNEVTRAIRACPNGWCCVAHGRMVNVYDWMLEEHERIYLDYGMVKDVCWVDSENIVISSDAELACGGMGLFSATTGKLRYNFQITDESQLNGYKAGILGVSSDYKLFSTYESNRWKYASDKKHGIGVWDQVTGKQINFFSMPTYSTSRLQWLHSTNCLMVATSNDVKLVDFRENNVVWSWYATEGRDMHIDFTDAMVIEDRSSICAIHLEKLLGFIDLRSTTAKFANRKKIETPSSIDNLRHGRPNGPPKLAFHEGQLFVSMTDCILVYSGSNWVRTSQHRQSHGHPICDFSISGDRLFALHRNEDVFDVWEPLSPPII